MALYACDCVHDFGVSENSAQACVCDCAHMHACRSGCVIGLCCTTGNNSQACALLTYICAQTLV